MRVAEFANTQNQGYYKTSEFLRIQLQSVFMTKLENAIIEANNKVIEAQRELTKWQIKHEERVLQKIALETVKGDDK